MKDKRQLNDVQKKWDCRLKQCAQSISSGPQASRVRRRLASYVSQVPDKYSWMVTHTLYHIRHLHDLKRPLNYGHYLTDHATLRTLERHYRIDVLKLKDLILSDIIKGNRYDFVERENRILTILPKIIPLVE